METGVHAGCTRHVIVPKGNLGMHRVGRSIPSRSTHIFDMHRTKASVAGMFRENPMPKHSLAAKVSAELESGIPSTAFDDRRSRDVSQRARTLGR